MREFRLSPLLAITVCGLLVACGPGRSPIPSGSGPGHHTKPNQILQHSDHPQLLACHLGTEFQCEIEDRIVDLVNQRRSAEGLSNLEVSYEAGFVARHWSEQQLVRGNLSHDGFPDERQARLGEEFPDMFIFFLAENLAAKTFHSLSADEIAADFVEMWWNSPGHRRNMLGPYRYLGAGVVSGPAPLPNMPPIYYATQLFH